MTSRPLDGSVALVTGASRGIGQATAIELARLGAHVVATGRSQGGLEETDDRARQAGGAPLTLLPLDLKTESGIDALGPSIATRFGRLDILVHAAAALGKLTPVPHIQPRDMADAVAVNLTATWRLIRTCAPLLVAAPAGRAVFLTSRIAQEPAAFWGIYGATKAALENLVHAWAQEVENTNLRVNLFDPRRTATRLRAMAFPAEDPGTLKPPEAVAPEIAALCLPSVAQHGACVVTRKEAVLF